MHGFMHWCRPSAWSAPSCNLGPFGEYWTAGFSLIPTNLCTGPLVNDEDLFKGLKVCKPETHIGKTHSIPKKKEKMSSCSKKYILERISPAILASGLLSRVVWIRERSVLSPSGTNQRVIWKFDLYPDIDAGLEKFKSLSSHASYNKNRIISSCLSLLDFNNLRP